MKHEYSTIEVAKIVGLGYSTVQKHVKQGAIKPSNLLKARGGVKYMFDEDSIKAYAEKIGVEPIWENSGKKYEKKFDREPKPKPEPTKPEPTKPEPRVDILHEYYVIRLGGYYLTDNMSLNNDLDKAKRCGEEAGQSYAKSTAGKLVLIQTTAKEIPDDDQ